MQARQISTYCVRANQPPLPHRSGQADHLLQPLLQLRPGGSDAIENPPNLVGELWEELFWGTEYNYTGSPRSSGRLRESTSTTIAFHRPFHWGLVLFDVEFDIGS